MKNRLLNIIWLTVLLVLTGLISCDNKFQYNDNNQNTDCSNNKFVATVDSSTTIEAVELSAVLTDNSMKHIYVSTAPATFMMPPLSVINIYFTSSSPGTYYLGKIGVKRDSVHYFDGQASYSFYQTPSTGYGCETDSIHTGVLTITNKDEQARQIYGTINFCGLRYGTTDTIITITNGDFQICY